MQNKSGDRRCRRASHRAIWGLLAGIQGRAHQFRGDIDDRYDPLVGHSCRPDHAQYADGVVIHSVGRSNNAAFVQNLVARFLADKDLYALSRNTAIEKTQDLLLLVESLEQDV